ncbi:MAG: hypothetical protein ACTSUV_04925 [Candidatus Ranarchaeia archaeon]
MSEKKKEFSKKSLVTLLEMERIWISKLFPKGYLTDEMGVWEVPNTPYTLNWLLWHIAESHNWVRIGVLEMKKEGGEPIGYPKFKSGEFSVDERISIFLKESRELQKKIESFSEKELSKMTTHLSMFGKQKDPSGSVFAKQTVPLGQIVYEDVFHVIGHMNVISYIKGLKGRMEGEKQKWPPY